MTPSAASTSETASAPASSPAVAEAPPAPQADCSPGARRDQGLSQGSFPVEGGESRRYLLYLPAAYDGSKRLPLVFNFHGYGSTADQQLLYSGMSSVAERQDFVVVTLNGQGSPRHYNQRPKAHQGEVSDITVVTSLLDSLLEDLCLDDTRVYAAGMSDGGVLAAALGCFAAERFAAVAAVGALIYDPACAEASPVPLLAFRGTADEIVPFDGGRVACCGRPVVNATRDDIASWAAHNGCATTPAVTMQGAVETSTYGDCDQGADVVLHAIVGGGHTWPGAIGLPGLGVTTRDIKASPAIWDFFAAHTKA